MADEGLHEIELNRKQMIFLFMTAAVVLVVTFLCGVLVGRGVRALKDPAVVADAMQAPAGIADPTAQAVALPPAAQGVLQSPPPGPPPQAEEDLSYYSRLEGQPAQAAAAPAAGQDGAAAPKPAPVEAKPAPAETKPAPVAAPPPSASAEPPGSGFFLKLVAYRDKAQANTLASRLAGKGYGAYVVQMPGRNSSLYSVRVGKFRTRKEADAARRRLEREERLKPLITR